MKIKKKQGICPRNLRKLPGLNRTALLELVEVLGGTCGYFLKGGIPVYKKRGALIQEIRRCSQKNFPNRIELAQFILESYPQEAQELPKDNPETELRNLVESIRLAALQVPPDFLYERVVSWIENKELFDFDEDEHLDWFEISIQEIEDDFELIQNLTLEQFSKKLEAASFKEFYNNFIRLAENCDEIEGRRPGEFPDPEPGFDFLENLLDWLQSLISK
ncbi:hypothetical protein [Myxosarcina sp. GI1]|uniref:hypothetical protein n=1 Tax=Myxosarcina sp. GI1 TaxID=1541065 RepID=UPI00055BE31B|nr:hypothetical protein [Myxosarcina sp. GI1]